MAETRDFYKEHQELVERAKARMAALGPEALELKLSLNAGDQIYCLADAYYDYNEEIRARKVISQRVGEILMVNNPGWEEVDGVRQYARQDASGPGIYSPYKAKGDRFIGLGNSFDDGTYRRAVPTDPGYMATWPEWKEWLGLEESKAERDNASLRKCLRFAWTLVIILTSIVMVKV